MGIPSESAAVVAALAGADQCVKCGLCLPHCPTYRLQQQEAEGPRGRIALAQGLLSGTLPAGDRLIAHLDGCLSCRACESVCPAKVPYGQLLDVSRQRLASPARTRLVRVLGAVLRSPAGRMGLRLLFSLIGRLPPGLRRATRGWRRVLSYVPSTLRHTRPAAAQQGAVALFAGCMGDVAERTVIQDALDLLAATGLIVALPPRQTCCGALHQHGGLLPVAERLATQNRDAFADCSTVLALTPGCGAALHDLAALPIAAALRDLCAFLAERLDQHPLPYAAMPLRVGVHVACTQQNVLRAGGATQALLRRIPQIQLVPLAPEAGCCGAAGMQFLTQPTQSDQLREPKLGAMANVECVVSANIGCTLHLLAGLRQQQRSLEVIHPVSLLARAWRAASRPAASP